MGELEDMRKESEQHYQAVYDKAAVYRLGLLNAEENPVPRHVRGILDDLDPALVSGHLGFYTALPGFIEGCRVLVVGCGSGRDAFVAAKLVGQEGQVVAIDPFADNIALANKLVKHQMQRFGFVEDNILFSQLLPEELHLAGLDDGSFDIIVVNYTLNLMLDKEGFFQKAYSLLKQGGELYLGALFANRRITPDLLHTNKLGNHVLRGAIYLEDFRRWLRKAGWESFRYMEKRRVVIEDKKDARLLSDYDLIYRVIRAFKLDNLEDLCENYGQSAEYLGTIPGYNQFFDLDDYHRFFVDKPIRVCGNTCALVQNTRFAPYFRVMGSRNKKHYGLYDYCHYCVPGIKEDNVKDYLKDGKEVCGQCSHKRYCVVDGHCQHEETEELPS